MQQLRNFLLSVQWVGGGGGGSPTNNAQLGKLPTESDDAEILSLKHRLSMQIGGARTCKDVYHIPTELPFCMPPVGGWVGGWRGMERRTDAASDNRSDLVLEAAAATDATTAAEPSSTYLRTPPPFFSFSKSEAGLPDLPESVVGRMPSWQQNTATVSTYSGKGKFEFLLLFLCVSPE